MERKQLRFSQSSFPPRAQSWLGTELTRPASTSRNAKILQSHSFSADKGRILSDSSVKFEAGLTSHRKISFRKKLVRQDQMPGKLGEQGKDGEETTNDIREAASLLASLSDIALKETNQTKEKIVHPPSKSEIVGTKKPFQVVKKQLNKSSGDTISTMMTPETEMKVRCVSIDDTSLLIKTPDSRTRSAFVTPASSPASVAAGPTIALHDQLTAKEIGKPGKPEIVGMFPNLQFSGSNPPKLPPFQMKPKKKIVIRRRFNWRDYPELEEFLVSNRKEYLSYSARNYSPQQKKFNNILTTRLLELASRSGYTFDPDHFSFSNVRDRIRCYYKSYVQGSKKRLHASLSQASSSEEVREIEEEIALLRHRKMFRL